ncbi:MAG: hypothetical protein KY395_04955 [Actinobacteria bacterium]|nr:hypothetical protein [Actinomycetota bacterium]
MWLWWVYGIGVLFVVVPVVLLLAVWIVRTALEIARYARDIVGDAELLASRLEPVTGLERTAELAAVAREGTTRYVEALGRRE